MTTNSSRRRPNCDVPLWQRVKAQVSVLDIATRHAEVRPSGSGRCVCRCLCGRNTDRRPSFVLYPASNDFHCFACGAHGNVIHLYLLVTRGLLRESIGRQDFLAGARDLAETYLGGQTEPIGSLASLAAAPRERGELDADTLAVLEAATQIYAETLSRHLAVRAWLTGVGPVSVPWSDRPVPGRGLCDATLETLRIGFAPSDGLARALVRHGVDLAAAQRVGLLGDGARRSERLRERAIFPVLDADRPVYLMGRALVADAHRPKFLGLADGSAYKRPMQHGDLSQGVLWVEGCFDVAALVQWRVPERRAVVGLLGTAHLQALSLVDGLDAPASAPDLIALDQDFAGKTAALKLHETLAKRGRRARIVFDIERHARLAESFTGTSAARDAELALDHEILKRCDVCEVRWGGEADSPGKLMQLGERGRELFGQVDA